MRRSPESIRESILKDVPIGTPKKQVDAWSDAHRVYRVWLSGEPDEGVCIAEYDEFISERFVDVFWVFDKDDNLIDVRVHKVGIGPF